VTALDETRVRRNTMLFLGLGAGVLIWRALAYRDPSSVVVIPDELRLPMAALGMFFVLCGLTAWLLRPGPATALFCVHGLGAGVHWGGSIGAGSEGPELALFFIYLAATAAGEAALLHLALIYGRTRRTGARMVGLLYLPAVLAGLLAPVAPVLPKAALQPVVGILLLLATLSGIAAGVIFIVRLVRADAETRRRDGLGIIVAALVLGFAISTLGTEGLLPGGTEVYNLANALIPLGFLLALVRRAQRA
jgi:hypothetical protein